VSTAILGINAYHGDAAAALIVDGRVTAAVAEERLNRVKHCGGFPAQAVAAVLAAGGVDARDLTTIAVGRNPVANFGHKLAYVLRRRPQRGLISDRAANQRQLLALRRQVARACDLPPDALRRLQLDFVEHHRAHAASAYYAAGHDDATVLTVDGFGDFVSTAWGWGRGLDLALAGRIYFPHSLGMFYQAVTQFIGFTHYGDEGKTMGLAPYGQPRFREQLLRFLQLRRDGRFALQADAFRHGGAAIGHQWAGGTPHVGVLYSEWWQRVFGAPRPPDEPLTERDRDLAASAQAVLEETVLRLIAAHCPGRRLVLAGGVALNSVLNGEIARQTPFAAPFVFPAAGDDGLAVGAALAAFVRRRRQRPQVDAVPLWGPAYTARDCERRARRVLADTPTKIRRLPRAKLVEAVADRLAAGKVVGWFQGGAEFGPRALGARSILADPRDAAMRERLNARIKRRESFRPFAPAVPVEMAPAWFEHALPSPAMLHVLPVRSDKRSLIPAVTHVDGSARVQTVDREEHPRFWALLHAFGRRTGVPVLLNTSFNEQEPIVCTPEEAIACFQRTDMDVLVLETTLIERVD